MSKTKPKKKGSRLVRPPCPKCNEKMTHFTKGARTDTWICTNPKCPNFDVRLSLSCPACRTNRVRTESGLLVCLYPACLTYKGDIFHDSELGRFEAAEKAKAAELEAGDAYARAKPGQGTSMAAKRRREARAKRVAASLGQTLIALPTVKREIVTTTYEIFKHIATQLILRRKVPEAGKPDKLRGLNLGEETEPLSDEDKIAAIARALKGSKWTARAAEGAAGEILKVLMGESVDGVQTDDEDVNHIVWTAGYFSRKVKEESWQGDKGKKAKLQQKFFRKGKPGDKESEADAKGEHEEARGEIRIFVQDGMKKAKGELVDGKQFEGSTAAIYKAVLTEVNPDDDEDPGRSAPAEEWLKAALPDKASA